MSRRQRAANATRQSSSRRELAVSGISCRFPGADDYRQFWRNLSAGANSIREIPPDRWSSEQFYSPDRATAGKSVCKWGGFLDRIDQFDHHFFRISPREAESMDPQQRQVLEQSWRCFEDAGLAPSQLSNKRIGVFAAIMTTDHYQDVLAPGVKTDAYACSGAYGSILANRISYFFGLRGPSVTVDAACASSLVALHQARLSILSGESEGALVVAANLNFNPWKYVSFSQAKMLSPSGQCRTFDQEADGYVPGEGVAAIFIQPLARALATGCPVHGLIRGSAVNHGGAALSLTAPGAEAQAEVLRAAYEGAGVNPRTIGYVEAHGTGTSLGDPIELEALGRVFKCRAGDAGYCRIGSVKTNIGHLEAAAGLAGIIKVLLMMRHGRLVPTLNLCRSNPLIDFERSAFRPVLEMEKWNGAAVTPRRGGVSSFGFGGANSHVVLEQYFTGRPAVRLRTGAGAGEGLVRQQFILSAKSPASLNRLIGAWKEFCQGEEFAELDFQDICRTLQEGRESFAHRFGFSAANKVELKRKLERADVDEPRERPQRNEGEGWVWSFGEGWEVKKTEALSWISGCAEFEMLTDAWSKVERKLKRGGSLLDAARGNSALLQFCLQFCAGRKFLEIASSPRLLAGEGAGEWVALALAEALPLKECLEGIYGGQKKREIARGKIAVRLASLGQTIEPFSGDDSLLRAVAKQISIDVRTWRSLVGKCSSLAENQRTFSRFVEEWAPVLSAYGMDVGAFLNEGKVQRTIPESACAVALALVTALRKLRAKWNLSEQLDVKNAALCDMAELVAGGALEAGESVALLLGDSEKFSGIARRLARRLAGRNDFPGNIFVEALRSGPVRFEGKDGWAGAGSQGLPRDFESGARQVHFGGVERVMAGHVFIPAPKAKGFDFAEAALALWLSGEAIHWDVLHGRAPFARACLPCYLFDNDVIPRKASPLKNAPPEVIGAGLLPNSSDSVPALIPRMTLLHQDGPGAPWRGTVSASEVAILRDHRICGRTIAPAALYLSMVRGFGGEKAELFDVQLPHAGLAEAKLELQLDFDANGRRFEFRDQRNILCSGNLQALDEAAASFALPSAYRGSGSGEYEEAIYSSLRGRGYEYGESLRVLGSFRSEKASIWAEVKPVESIQSHDVELAPFLDAGLQAGVLAGASAGLTPDAQKIFLPCAIKRVVFFPANARVRWVRIDPKLLTAEDDGFGATISILDASGTEAVRLEGVKFKGVPKQFLMPSEAGSRVTVPQSGSSNRQLIEELVMELVAAKTNLAPGDISRDESFFSLGIESIALTEIQDALDRRFANLPPILLFEHPNVNALVDFLANRPMRDGMPEDMDGRNLGKNGTVAEANGYSGYSESQVEEKKHTVSTADENARVRDIAIIGMHGRFPMAPDLRSYWENLRAGRNCVSEIPAERWNLSGFFDTEMGHDKASFGKWGGFIDDADKFDALFFNISPQEAELMDPQQRLLLESVWASLEDSGYAASRRRKDQAVGVFLGSMWSEYSLICHERGYLQGRYAGPGAQGWAMANRISYWFDFRGPSIALDTACSSSLVAVHMACQSLLNDECEMAVAGGVNLSLHPSKYIYLSRAQFLSRDGLCRSFGENGSGYVPGEGVGTVFLKPLAKAIRDGDRVLGVIRGSATNHGGRATGFTVPNPEAHTSLISDALKRAGTHPNEISYVECHGTGTSLGDPIEIAGLARAFENGTARTDKCLIGSVKSNIGHLEAAAGIAGLIKLLLCLRHGVIPPTLHCDKPNPKIDFDKTPFSVVKNATEWRAANGKPRVAGLSSFGAGGANAHLILEEAPSAVFDRNASAPMQLICLSAKSEESLRGLASGLVDYLKLPETAAADLGSIAFTLNTGREEFDFRLSIIADSPSDFRGKLERYVENQSADLVWSGRKQRGVSRDRGGTGVGAVRSRESLEMLAENWVRGAGVDWDEYYRGRRIRRLSLPSYPFRRIRHWILESADSENVSRQANGNGDAGARSLEWRGRFEPFALLAKNHRVRGRDTLPGACLVELAREAAEKLFGRRAGKATQVVWLSAVTEGALGDEFLVRFSPPTDGVARCEVFTVKGGEETLRMQGNFDVTASIGDIGASERRSEIEGNGKLNFWTEKECYRRFASLGLEYGAALTAVKQIRFNGSISEAEVALPEKSVRGGKAETNAILLDAVLQTCLAIASDGGGVSSSLALPFSVGEISCIAELPQRLRVHVTRISGGGGGIIRFDVVAFDKADNAVLRLKDFGLRLLKSGIESDAGGALRGCHVFWPTEALVPLKSAGPSQILEKAREFLTGSGRSLVVFDDDQNVVRSLRKLMATESGAVAEKIVWVRAGEGFRQSGASDFELRPDSGVDYGRLLKSLRETGRGAPSFIFLWPKTLPGDFWATASAASASGVEGRLRKGLWPLFHWAKALISNGIKERVFGLTVVRASTDGISPDGGAIAGFCRSLRLEAPKLLLKTLCTSVEDAPGETLPLKILEELLISPEEDLEIRDAGAQRWLRNFESVSEFSKLAQASEAGRMRLRREGVYWITGGLGGLGEIFARYLAKNFQARLLLSGRSTLSDDARARMVELEQLGGAARYFQADVCDEREVRAAAEFARKEFGRIDGVIHSAGVLADALLRNKEEGAFRRVVSAKIFGALNLDRATSRDDLSLFAMFSSLVAGTGNLGQTDYAAGNRFLDSFARVRAGWAREGARSGVTLSLGWPLWLEGGMRVDEGRQAALRAIVGSDALPTQSGLGLFEAALGLAGQRGESHFIFAKGDGVRVAELLGARQAEAAAPRAEGLPGSENQEGLRAVVEREIKRLMAGLLKVPLQEIDVDAPMGDYGFDSVSFTQFSIAINDFYGTQLTPALFFEYSSARALSEYLTVDCAAQVAKKHPSAAGQSPKAALEAPRISAPSLKESYAGGDAELRATPVAGDPIAIVGMAGVFPKSNNTDELWRNIMAGRDLISEAPVERWDWRSVNQNSRVEGERSGCRWGGFYEGMDQFDPLFFGISPGEAACMDPQQRVFLETVWHALEDAACPPSELAGTKTGIFVGVSTHDYQQLINECGEAMESFNATGTIHSILANRVSYLLDLRGPSEVIDTACSSSLVAVHRAAQSLRCGECEVAIAGGVNGLLSPSLFIAFEKAGMLAPDGKCKTFSKGANGYVRAEGAGALVLKPLHSALRDGDSICGVILSSAVNHGGRANSLTAPTVDAQAGVLIDAYRAGNVDPATVGYIETHGTGTELGDPIEVNALKKAFGILAGGRANAEPHCALGSVKTWVGHMETAAGVAGMINALLAMRNKTLPGLKHFREANPYAELSGSPFYFSESQRPWKSVLDSTGRAIPRRAGVSSFGFGGVNAHVVLEEYVEAVNEIDKLRKSGDGSKQLVILSGKTPEALERNIAALKDWIGRQIQLPRNERASLADVAYTLQMGRQHFKHRVALLGETLEEVAEGLGAAGDSGESQLLWKGVAGASVSLFRADDSRDQEFLGGLWERGCFERIAEMWVNGVEFPWTRFWNESGKRKLRLPGYVFARERYWVDGPSNSKSKQDSAAAVLSGSRENTSSEQRTTGAESRREKINCYGLRWLELNEPEKSEMSSDPRDECTTIVFSGRTDGGLAAQFEAGAGKLVRAHLGRNWHKASARLYSVNPVKTEDYEKLLQETPGPLRIYFLGAFHSEAFDSADFSGFNKTQENGACALAKLFQAIGRAERANDVRELCVVTRNLWSVSQREKDLQPAAGGVIGLARVARSEFPDVPILCLDLDVTAEVGSGPNLARTIRRCPVAQLSRAGSGVVALRDGKYFGLSLGLIEESRNPTILRERGVYVIFGGTGGLGGCIAKFLAGKFRARVVLAGASELDDRRRALIREIEAAGGEAHFIRADLTQEGATKLVLTEAETRFGRINGIVHSVATVDYTSLLKMSDTAFRKVLDLQARSCLALVDAVKNRELDFVSIFSSAAPVIGLAETGNYAAGCSLRDSLGTHLRVRHGLRVRVINWGTWRHTGLAAWKGLEEWMTQLGVRSLTPEEGVEIFERALAGDDAQVVAAKVDRAFLENCGMLQPSAGLSGSPGFFGACDQARSVARSCLPGWSSLESGYEALREATHRGLWSTLFTSGVFGGSDGHITVENLGRGLNAESQFGPLLGALIEILQRNKYLERVENGFYLAPGAAAMALSPSQVERECEQIAKNYPDFARHVRMLKHCLGGYLAVLRGEVSTLELLFPNGSPDLVASLYSGNPPADQFNSMAASAVCSYAQTLAGGKAVRILEIGAGTGSTTKPIVAALSSLNLAKEYLATDVSLEFAQFGKDALAGRFDFVKFANFDLEKPIEGQGYKQASFDVIIAANAAHTARRLDASVSTIKALLKPGGLLVLNEITRPDEFLTVVFGLLPGWWHSLDMDLRLFGSPFASQKTWDGLLRGGGFEQVEIIGENEKTPIHGNRQSLILALANDSVAEDRSSAQVKSNEETAQAANLPGTGKLRPAPGQLMERVRRVLARVVVLDEAALDLDTPFAQYGVDSLVAIRVAQTLNAELGIQLRKTDLYNFSTIRALCSHIKKRHSPGIVQPPPSNPAPPPAITEKAIRGDAIENKKREPITVAQAAPHSSSPEPIAVIGMSGRFAEAPDLEAFWKNLAAGRDSIREVPLERWDVNKYYDPDPLAPGKTSMRHGGFMESVDCFDSLFFGISPEEARVMDPQQRIILEEAWKAIENAGYPVSALTGRKCGVFVGVAHGDFEQMLAQRGLSLDSHASIGNSCAILPARIAYFLNLKGPCLAIDTGCSSSLVALHQACQSLLSGESEIAIAGGVNVLNSADRFVFLSKAGMASPTGRCHAFDARADGFVPGEGAAVVVLKPLRAALRDCDPIHAVIRATAINQDGKSNGITAPSATSQTALECAVYRGGGINPDTIDYVEAHGTGTKLGDPIEFHALTDAFQEFTRLRQFCALGSVKTNVGHTMACAGITGLLKVILAMQAGKIPASLNFSNANEQIDFNQSPFYVPVKLQEWRAVEGRPRRGAISSFGFSGTNAHIIVDGFEEAARPRTDEIPSAPWHLATLSAANKESLAKVAVQMATWLERRGDSCSAQEICYTLNVRRSHLLVRAAWVFRTLEEWVDALRAFARGETTVGGFFGQNEGSRSRDEKGNAQSPLKEILKASELNSAGCRVALEKAARDYIQGGDFNWNAFYEGYQVVPISLPAYPFEAVRHTLPSARVIRAGESFRRETPGASHPFLREEKLVSGAVRFSARLEAEHPLLRDHSAGGHVIAPAALLLEIARAACARAGGHEPTCLENVYWNKPLIMRRKIAELEVIVNGQNGARSFVLQSSSENQNDIYAEGTCVFEDSGGTDDRKSGADILEDPEELIRRCGVLWSSEKVYETFAAQGWHYGPAYRAIRELKIGRGEALARLEVPVRFEGLELGRWGWFPPLLDGALQAAVGIWNSAPEASAFYMPVGIRRIEWHGPLTEEAWAHVSAAPENGDRTKSFDVSIIRSNGGVLARILGCALRPRSDKPIPTLKGAARTELMRGIFEKVQRRELDRAEAQRILTPFLS